MYNECRNAKEKSRENSNSKLFKIIYLIHFSFFTFILIFKFSVLFGSVFPGVFFFSLLFLCLKNNISNMIAKQNN